ncbi:hypothetical protein MMC17_000615 [Xylographa soralifera]|nr:hypothetical protein [Xylographa soralifera]
MYCLLLLLSAAALPALASTLYSNSFGVPANETYDYVVIGGGTAGNTIAARLAEDPSLSVAVIEAGGFYEVENGNRSVVPAYSTDNAGSLPNTTQPLVDWGFVTTPQAGANNRTLHYAHGKTLGGASARNYMAYQRGTLGSFQTWADIVGDQSYTFDNLLPYFQKSVNFTPPNFSKRVNNSTLNYDASAFNNSLRGPLQVSYENWASPLSSWAQKAFTAVGILPNEGFNSGNLFGSMWVSHTISPQKQHRSSSQTSFLDQAIRTTTLMVYTKTLAKRILFDAQKKAYTVEVNTAGLSYTLSARKEIILSAGAFQSPQLLMVSGIGPPEILRKYNIPVVASLRGVGQNMWDHILFGSSHRVQVLTKSKLTNDPVYAAQAKSDYLNNQTGMLTSPTGSLAWEKIPATYRSSFSPSTSAALATFPGDWPEIEYLVFDAFLGYSLDYSDADPADGYNYGTLANALVAPLSRGNVTIVSSDTADAPVINPNWLTDPADAEVAVAAFKRSREVWGQLQSITIGPEYFPGAAVQTDEDILAFIRQSCIQLYHAACTCAMGMAGDPNAVVDSHAKVFGVKGLRVVDASAFPILIPGHPQSSVYMLAEKIADDIKNGR